MDEVVSKLTDAKVKELLIKFQELLVKQISLTDMYRYKCELLESELNAKEKAER